MADTVESLDLDIARLLAEIEDLKERKKLLLDPDSQTPEARLAFDLFQLFPPPGDTAGEWYSELQSNGMQNWNARLHAKYLNVARQCIAATSISATRKVAQIIGSTL
jgi:hypothetical protein